MVKRTEYSDNKQIIATIQESVTNSIWTAFDIDLDGKVILERQSAFCPNQTFYTLDVAEDRTVEKIISLDVNNTHLLASYKDVTLIGEKISLTNPVSSRTAINREVGLVEDPIDATINQDAIFFLTPGNISGTDAEVHVYSLSGSFDETVVLTGIQNAKSIYAEEFSDVWILTNNSPSELIRIFPDGGGSYTVETTILN